MNYQNSNYIYVYIKYIYDINIQTKKPRKTYIRNGKIKLTKENLIKENMYNIDINDKNKRVTNWIKTINH